MSIVLPFYLFIIFFVVCIRFLLKCMKIELFALIPLQENEPIQMINSTELIYIALHLPIVFVELHRSNLIDDKLN